jgi:hypothetical protein
MAADDDLKAELERLKMENALLKKAGASSQSSAPRELYCKISEKGALSVYGLGRFPVTLYKEQWVKLLSKNQMISDFIEEHKHQLKSKEA